MIGMPRTHRTRPVEALSPETSADPEHPASTDAPSDASTGAEARKPTPESDQEASPKQGSRSRESGRVQDEQAGAAQAVVVALQKLPGAIEAVLLSVDKPLTSAKLAEVVRPEGDAEPAPAIEQAIESLNEQYEKTGRSFRIERVAGGYRAMTTAEFAEPVAQFHASRSASKLSRAAIETLSIVAYRQPVTRAELESIRGVACGEVLRTLLERRLIAIVGRAEEVGRPMLYGTSKRFLEVFGLASVKDLPQVGDLAPKQTKKQEQVEEGEAPEPDDAAKAEASEQAAPEIDETDKEPRPQE
ncbi:MAG: SMC-Scp complex subunit ScpB [Phycisphaeraceae bacterium]|nr:MAG: SMC-Scp complex subunit ScpB [Phycisphaeraceae bacterium]